VKKQERKLTFFVIKYYVIILNKRNLLKKSLQIYEVFLKNNHFVEKHYIIFVLFFISHKKMITLQKNDDVKCHTELVSVSPYFALGIVGQARNDTKFKF